jgi:hypothetical protein
MPTFAAVLAQFRSPMNFTGDGCGFSSSLDVGRSYVDRGYLEYRQYEA